MYGHVNTDETFGIKALYTAFEAEYDSNYYFNGEYHNFWEMVIVLDGELGVTAGSDLFILKKGQAILHEPMEFHRLWSEGNSHPKIVIFSFSAVSMPKYSSKIFEIEDLEIPVEILKDIYSAFKTEYVSIVDIKDRDNIHYQVTLKKLEIFILHTISQKIRKNDTVKSQPAKNYSTIVNVMENNIDKNLSVREIADLCNMSEINLKKTFSRYSGMGVMAYFNQLKITASISMLKNGMTVQEAANALGFSNQNYFSTVFKRITGHPPTYYK